MQPWHTPFPIWNQPVPCPILTVASWPAYRFLRRQVRWSGISISLRIFHSLLWSTQSKALAWSMKQKRMFFWNSLAFSVIQQMLAIWSLVPLPFLNPAWTSESSRFMYCSGYLLLTLGYLLLTLAHITFQKKILTYTNKNIYIDGIILYFFFCILYFSLVYLGEFFIWTYRIWEQKICNFYRGRHTIPHSGILVSWPGTESVLPEVEVQP